MCDSIGTLHAMVKQYWSISGLHRKQLNIQYLSLAGSKEPNFLAIISINIKS